MGAEVAEILNFPEASSAACIFLVLDSDVAMMLGNLLGTPGNIGWYSRKYWGFLGHLPPLSGTHSQWKCVSQT